MGGGEIFRTCPDRPWGPLTLLYNGYRVFPEAKSGQGVTLTPHPLLVPWSSKSRAIPLHPYGPYGLYRASVPVQGAIYLLFTSYYDTWHVLRAATGLFAYETQHVNSLLHAPQTYWWKHEQQNAMAVRLPLAW